MFGLNILYVKIVAAATILTLVSGIYYFWHVKPIIDLEESNADKQEIILKAKNSVEKINAKSEAFEDKWREISTIEENADAIIIEDSTGQVILNTEYGKHAIIIK